MKLEIYYVILKLCYMFTVLWWAKECGILHNIEECKKRSKYAQLSTLCIVGGTSGKARRNAWMETTIIHKFLLPPFSLLLLANDFLRNILFTHFDLLFTDMQ